MIICYRLENKDGTGLFFFPNGRNKTKQDIKFLNAGLYAFLDEKRFLEPSYINFYNDKENYILYEIGLSSYIKRNKYNEIIFLPNQVLYKKIKEVR